jgi:hypothetical protein
LTGIKGREAYGSPAGATPPSGLRSAERLGDGFRASGKFYAKAAHSRGCNVAYGKTIKR